MDIIRKILKSNPSQRFDVNDVVKIIKEDSVWSNVTGVIYEANAPYYKIKLKSGTGHVYITMHSNSLCLVQ